MNWFRSRRESIARLLLLAFICLLCPSCGSSSEDGLLQGSLNPPAAANGKIVLPSGLNLSPASLTVLTAAGAANVTSAGDYTVNAPVSRPVLTMAVQGDEKIVLIGFLTDGTQTLSAESTTIALLFYALGGPTLPHDQQLAFLQKIAEDPRLPGVVQAITSALISNPTFVSDGSATVNEVLRSAQAAWLQPNSPKTEAIRARQEVQSAKAGPNSRVKVQPEEPARLSGASLEVTDQDDLDARNFFRRSKAELYVYKVGHRDQNNTEVKLDKAESQDGHAPTVLGSVTVVQQSFDILASFFNGGLNQPAHATLGNLLFDEDQEVPGGGPASATLYKVVMLSPWLSLETKFPSILDDARFGDEAQFMLGRLRELEVTSFFVDYFFPILGSVTGFGSPSANLTEAVQSFTGNLLISVPNALAQVSTGTIRSWQDTVLVFMTALGKGQLLDSFAHILGEVYGADISSTTAQKALSVFARANQIIFALNLILESVDVLRVTHDLFQSNPSEAWDVEVGTQRVKLDYSVEFTYSKSFTEDGRDGTLSYVAKADLHLRLNGERKDGELRLRGGIEVLPDSTCTFTSASGTQTSAFGSETWSANGAASSSLPVIDARKQAADPRTNCLVFASVEQPDKRRVLLEFAGTFADAIQVTTQPNGAPPQISFNTAQISTYNLFIEHVTEHQDVEGPLPLELDDNLAVQAGSKERRVDPPEGTGTHLVERMSWTSAAPQISPDTDTP